MKPTRHMTKDEMDGRIAADPGLERAPAIARAFATSLLRDLGPGELRVIDMRNREEPPDSGICHSHDFCDANVYMESVFHAVTGRNILDSVPGPSSPEERLWAFAWDYAKTVGFERLAQTDEVIGCSFCGKGIWFTDSWSPGDDAICAECDHEVTGREHPPSLDPRRDPPPCNRSAVLPLPLDGKGNLVWAGREGDRTQLTKNDEGWVEMAMQRDGYLYRYAGFCRGDMQLSATSDQPICIQVWKDR